MGSWQWREKQEKPAVRSPAGTGSVGSRQLAVATGLRTVAGAGRARSLRRGSLLNARGENLESREYQIVVSGIAGEQPLPPGCKRTK